VSRVPPQPHPSRITPFAGHPIVVGVTPDQPELVTLTAAELARALGVGLFFAYADPGRVVEREFPDGTVQHVDLDPDLSDDEQWRRREAHLKGFLTHTLAGAGVGWEFRYLAGRADRALTHLARAVDAAVIVVGTRRPGGGGRMHDLLQGSVGAHLSHHQHRPVLAVPTEVVDWKTPLEWR
jgi:nucleotide-binding universal stress UspA family protein